MTIYAKAITAFFAALGTWGATAAAEGGIAGGEWFGLCAVAVTTFAVFQVPNTPQLEPDAGHADGVVLALLCVVTIAVVLLLFGVQLGDAG